MNKILYKTKQKKGEFGFVWFFALVVGGAILVLAIYGAMKIGDTKDYQSTTEIAKQISILTDPMQAGFAEGKFGKINFNQDTRIDNYCFRGGFGRNEISVAVKTNNKWSNARGSTSIQNKYIFSSEENEGNEFYVFSSPFVFPYKVADIIILMNKNYCFINSPDEVSNQVDFLSNVRIKNCTKDEIRVCFNSGDDCDMTVYGACTSNCNSIYDEGTVEKNGETVKFVGNLMLPAIFSSKEIYDCNVERLLVRDSSIARVFAEKSDLMNARDCNTNMKADLIAWQSIVGNSSAEEIISLNSISKNLEARNRGELCGLW